jgi:regulator of protease activity HflC (stomatin/prohibitin superfamily)
MRSFFRRFYIVIILLFLYVPILTLIVFSFNESKTMAKWGGCSLKWYGELFTDSTILNALSVTLSIAVLAALISTVIGTVAALGINSFHKRAKSMLIGVSYIPMVNADIVTGVSINDLRKNLRDLNEHMERECASSAARYGIILDASLITGIDPPAEVETALAAINTAHNQVSSDISLAQALADQKIVQSRRAVEIETLNAQAEVEPLTALANQLQALREAGPETLQAYLRNVRLQLFAYAKTIIQEVK